MIRPEKGVTTTDAFAGVLFRTNTLSFGEARWTRADCIELICDILRANSFSIAAVYLTCSMN